MSEHPSIKLFKKARENLIRTLSQDIYSDWSGREEAILRAQEEFDLATAECERNKVKVIDGTGVEVEGGKVVEFKKRGR